MYALYNILKNFDNCKVKNIIVKLKELKKEER